MTTGTTSPPSATSPPPPPPPPPTSNRSGLWILLALVALVVLGAGGLAAAAWLVRDVEGGSTTVTAVDTIRFRGDAAELTVVEADRADVEVAWETRTSPWREADVTVEVEDGVLVVTADCPDVFVMGCSTETDITVPSGSLATLDVRIGAGGLHTTGTSAEVVASVGAGEVLLEEHRGTRAVLRIDAGQVEVDSGAVPRELDVIVDVGGIDIAVPEADYDVDASVDIGTVATSVREVDDALHRISARVDVGDVEVHMR